MSASAANNNSANCFSSNSCASSQNCEMMAATLDWRHSLEPQTPSAQQVDVLHEFIASWDDELLTGTGAGDPNDAGAADNTPDNDNGGPMMALLQSAGAVTSSTSPRHARLVHAQSSLLTTIQKVYASQPKTANATSPTSSTSGSEKGVAAVQPEEVVPARKRIRRKVEIAQLRDEGAFLEKKLYELREYWKSAPEKLQQQRRANATDTDSEESLVCAEPLWKQIAYYQKELLTESEQKNQELKQEYVMQRKLARELRKLLLKRAMEPAVFDTALYLVQPRNPLQVLNQSHQTFERLLNDTGPLYAEFEHVKRIIHSRSAKNNNLPFRDWQCHEGTPPKSMFVDMVDSYTLPFDRHQVNTAMRKCYGENNTTNTEKYLCEFFKCSGDAMLRQALYAYTNERCSGHVRQKEAVRNFSDETQSVFLVVILIQPATSTGEPIAGITLREQKWTIIRNGPGGAGTSIVQTYHRITQEDCSRDYEAFWTQGMIMEVMVPMWNSSLQGVHRRLESFLIEQGMRSSRRLQASEVWHTTLKPCELQHQAPSQAHFENGPGTPNMMADSAANATPPNASANTGGENLPRHSLEFPDASAGQARELLAFLESWEGEEELLALEGDGDASATMTMSPLTAGILASGSSSWRALGDSPTSLSLSFCTSSGEENKRARERPEEQHAAAPPKKRVRRIVEITQLRHEASVLEKTLSDLNEYWKHWKNVRAQAAYRTGGGGGIFTSNRVFRHTTINSSAERNANRQRQLRSTAEEENRRLREEYQCRRKNTKAFYKLLKRRATTHPEFNCVFQLMQQPAASQEVLARSGDIFQALLQDVHRMQIERGRIDSIIESRRRPICTFRDWNVREDGDEANGIFLELVDSAVLPFDRLQVNRAMHRLYSEQTSTTTHFCEYSHVSANKDTVVRQAVCAYSNADGEGHVRHQEVVRHESDDTQSLFLRVTRIQPVGPKGEPIAGLSLLEKQWTFIRSGGGDDDGQEEEASSSSSCSGALSTVQSYHKITLVSIDEKYEAFWTKAMIMDSMVPIWDFSRAKAHRRLESFLIDQGISNSRRLQASEVR